MPGPGYTREFTYNEEAQLLGISHSGTLAYQYAYGADGNRRWSKDIANDLWTWYPCGVACGAGEMVEETSTLTGSNWATSGQYLRAGSGCSSLLIRRKSMTDDEYHHVDMVGVFGILTNATGGILQNNVCDAYMVPQYSDQNSQILSKQIAVCMVVVAEPDMQSTPNGGGISFQGRALNPKSKKSIKAHPCKKKQPPKPCITRLCKIEHCLVDAGVAGIGACIAGLISYSGTYECLTCLAFANAWCALIEFIPWIGEGACAGAYGACLRSVCVKPLILCIVLGGVGAVFEFIICYNDAFEPLGF